MNIGSISRSNRNPFLDIELLVQTAMDVGAQAIHPGYGYISENPGLASRASEVGLIFIGPSASAMSTLGDKRSAKEYLGQRAPDVPLIPGYAERNQDIQSLEKAANDIGFPLMIKASAGGGGKGMRIVREVGKLKQELERAQSEAQRSFGSADCILEKYIEDSKHVEIQVVGDSHGEVISLFDRDCSVQRRHQKVIEETPCTFLGEETRQRMCVVAVRLAKLIGYANAGTIEFVVDVQTGHFYFLEVNARLQVEHPITEEVTGVDLVSLQLFVAAGGAIRSLPFIRNLKQAGHAIECRLCAEDPQRNFLPDHGKVHLWLPACGDLAPGRDLRYETAVQTGSTVSIYFDPMIAKIVVWAPTRALAIEKMARTLAHTACVGVKTNQLFLQRSLLHAAFQKPAYTTSFIPANLGDLLDTQLTPSTLSIIPALALRKLAEQSSVGFSRPRAFQNVRKQFRNQRFDPVNAHCDIISLIQGEAQAPPPLLCLWKPPNAGAYNATKSEEEAYLISVPESPEPSQKEAQAASPANELTARYNEISRILRSGKSSPTTLPSPHRFNVSSWYPIDGNPAVRDSWLASTMVVTIDGSKTVAHITMPSTRTDALPGQVNSTQNILVHLPSIGTWVEFQRGSLLSYVEGLRSLAKAQIDAGQESVTAPMPCKVLSVLKQDRDEVKSGETVMVIESMKMEMSITVNANGRLRMDWKKGDFIEEGKVLCSVV